MQENTDVVENDEVVADEVITEDVVEEKSPKEGLIFDLDTLACNGHDVLFDVLTKILGKKASKLTKFYFAKKCIARNLSALVPELIEDFKLKKVVEEEFIENVKGAFAESLINESKVTDGLLDLVKAAQEKGFVVGVFSSLDEESAQLLLEKIGLANSNVTLSPYAPRTINSFIGEHWRRLAVELSVAPGECVAITSDNNSCKAALSSGMRVVVLPTDVSSFQDFGGANMIVDELSPSVIEASLKLLERD